MNRWTWIEGGVRADGETHGFAQADETTIAQAIGLANRTAEVQSVLKSAYDALRLGMGDYTDAATNVDHLLLERRRADRNWRDALALVGQLFLPPMKFAGWSSDETLVFAAETAEKVTANLRRPAGK